jgi:hypothetical protein
MTSKAKAFAQFLVSRAGVIVLRDAGYYAIGAGLLVAGIVGLRELAPGDGIVAHLVQSSPLIATAAGAIWVVVKS